MHKTIGAGSNLALVAKDGPMETLPSDQTIALEILIEELETKATGSFAHLPF